MQPLRRALTLAAPPSRTHGGRPRTSCDRARNAAPGRDGTHPTPLPHQEPWRRGCRLRRLPARTPCIRGGNRRCSVRACRTDPGLRVPRGRCRRPLRAVTAGRSALQEAAPTARDRRRNSTRGRRPSLLASGARRAPAALLGEEGDGAARRRLHPRRPVALHVPPLLGGRSDRGQPSDGLARKVPRPGREEGQPAPGTLARRHPRARPRHRQGSGRVDLGRRPVQLLQRARLGPGRGADARGNRSHGEPTCGRRAADRRQRRGSGGPPPPAADPFPVLERFLEPRALSAVGRPVPTEAGRPRRHAGRRACRSTASH